MTKIDATTLRNKPAVFADVAFGQQLFEYQREFLAPDNKRKALVCGRQVGKTEVCALDGLHYASTHGDVTVLITAPTQRQSSELFKRVKDLIGRAEHDWGIERSTQTIVELANGSRIICLPSGSDGNSIRGYTADYIIVDEAAFVEDTVFTSVLLPMLATTEGTLALASTPFGKRGFLYEQAYRSEEWHITEVPSHESPLVDTEFVDEQRATLSELEYRQEILGEFVEAADTFFARELIANAINPDATFRGRNAVTLGVDLARHGHDRTVILPVDDDGVVGPIHRSTDWSLSEGAARVASLVDEYDVTRVVVDETGVGAGAVEMLEADVGRRLVEGVKFTIDRKQSLYNSLKAALDNGSVTLPDDRLLRQELTDLEYEMTRGGKTKIGHPDGGHDDHPDALALAVSDITDADSGYASTSDDVVVL